MGKRVFHSATVTLKLPSDMSGNDEIAALQAAGIPVDAQCIAESGFLFVRASRDGRSNFFRWFASGIAGSRSLGAAKPARRFRSADDPGQSSDWTPP
jgi:hypothetical protein